MGFALNKKPTRAAPAAAAPSKYRNKKTEWQGETFDSKAELSRFLHLQALERGGLISDLERQPKFEIVPAVKLHGKTIRAKVYKADFRYKDADGKIIVEDVKGMLTETYRLKRHLMMSVWGIEIKEVR